VLYLCHCEFPHSQQALLRVDLISEAKAYLRSCEGHPPIVVLNQAAEVNKDTLSCFWSEVALRASLGSNLSTKHEIERQSPTQVISSLWGLDLQFLDSLV
jgi:hypothetical protein